jgi:hypothetical protein
LLKQQPIVRAVDQRGPTVVTPPASRRISYKGRSAVVNVGKGHVRPSPLASVARERDQLFQASREAILNLKGIGKGRVLIITGNGPSISEAPLEKLKDDPKVDILSVNKPDRRVWPTKYWCFVDHTQLTRNRDLWDSYKGMSINSGSVRERRQNQVVVRNIAGRGFSKDLLQGFYIGRSTVFASMQVALWMDYARVYVFGCDMTAVGGKLHFYGQNPDVDNKNRMERFAKEAESYALAAQILNEQERAKFVFVSTYNSWPFTQRFPKADQRTAVDEIIEFLKHL